MKRIAILMGECFVGALVIHWLLRLTRMGLGPYLDGSQFMTDVMTSAVFGSVLTLVSGLLLFIKPVRESAILSLPASISIAISGLLSGLLALGIVSGSQVKIALGWCIFAFVIAIGLTWSEWGWRQRKITS